MVDALAAASAAKWIGSALYGEAKYLYGVKSHIRRLQRDLIYMHGLLQDVDANPHLTHQDRQLRNFAQDIQELTFCAEDAIDSYIVDFATKIDNKSLFSKLACLAAHPYQIHMLIKEIEAIQQAIQEAKKRWDTFKIIPITPGDTVPSCPSLSPSTEIYVHLDDEVVVGIDDDISNLVKRLVHQKDDFKVLAIVGTGGAGKTTLATQLYHHSQVKSQFPHKAFVSISQQWSRIDVLQRIFKEVKWGDVIPSSESELVKELRYFLKDKQCLVVLDDMWKKEAWDDIYPMLPHSNRGCRVIITTRIEEVPLYADSKCIIHEPKLLTMDQKWELFRKIVVEGRVGIEENVEFEKLGREMLEKCQGLPLAVVTLAGVLRTKQEWYQWEEISKAYAEYILKGKRKPNYGAVEDMLELSYLDLPTYLKPCFLYFAIFLEDFKYSANQFIGMWIAEGFVTNDLQKGQETLEDVARQLLEELARRYILRVTLKEKFEGKFEIFGCMTLCESFALRRPKNISLLGQLLRHSDQGNQDEQLFCLELHPQEKDHLRTLLVLGDGMELPTEARENLKSIPNKFKLLRVLCIWDQEHVDMPDQIGNLIHLRYLSIVRSNIFYLPKSIRNLRNLLYLLYDTRATTDVVEVPNGLVGNMKNLRGLALPRSLQHGSLNKLGLNGPKNLQWLTTGAGTWMTKELPTLTTTVHEILIYNMKTKEEMEALYQCSGIREHSLRRLTLTNYSSMSSEEALEFDLGKLRDCTALWDLELICPLASDCNGAIIIQLPPNLVSLYLSRSAITEQDELMYVLSGLPKLKYLSLGRGSYLGSQLNCTNSGFLQLQVLKLRRLENLEEWIMEEGAMAHLRIMRIEKCMKLKRLPESIRFITTLKELQITEMPEEFCKRIGYEGSTSEAEDSYIIQHVPSVIVNVGS